MRTVTRMCAFWLVIAAGLLWAQEPPRAPATPNGPADLAVLAAAYKADLDEVAADYEKWFAALQTWYLAGLDKLQAERIKTGDLEGTLAFKAERERIAARTETTREQVQAMPATLAKLRAVYEPALKKIVDEAARRKDVARSKHLAHLDALQTRLTTSGAIDEALLVRTEKDRFATERAEAAGAAVIKPTEVPGLPASKDQPAQTPEKNPHAESDESNLLTNGNFKKGTAAWELLNWGKSGRMEIDTNELHDGSPTLRVENHEPCHSFIRQIVTGKPNTRYRITGYIKTKDVEPAKSGDKTGAVLMIGGTRIYTPAMQRTEQWRKVTADFTTNDNSAIRIGPSLGTDSAFVTGTAWFSDLRLTEVGGNAQK